jgi:hypothetical protein
VHRFVLRITTLVLAVLAWAAFAPAAEWQFQVQFTKNASAKPYTGRVYVFFSRRRREPRTGPGWFNPELFIARDVKDVAPGETVAFDAARPQGMLAYPKPLAEMDLAGYRAQAVIRFNPFDRNIGTGPGNGYSEVLKIGKDEQEFALTVEKLVPERKFRESEWSKLLRVRSKLLSDFHKRDVFMNAAVILPASYYDEPDRRYPVLFTIPGFGGTHFGGQRSRPVSESNRNGVEFLRVLLDPSCPRGHHVFADSANNGPVGKALITELIPALDAKYRTVAEPGARFLTGHSSGGWSSLWLQVAYPDFFGGTWSTSPDPVDFRDFQRINLYRPGENMYRDNHGELRPLARGGGRVLLTYEGFAKMEWVLGYGGQLHSFEAVFSPRGKDGTPRLLWDRRTGVIDTEVANTWKPYDIRLKLVENWKTLGPKLEGKLHVFMGDADTFYLEGATIKLKEALAKLSEDPVIEIHPGKDHGSIMTQKLRDRIRKEMVDAFLERFPDAGTKSQ